MSNIKDDIKILKEFNSLKVNSPFRFVEISYPRLQKAIYNILSDYTRQKQINEEHKKLNGELREKVKGLEEVIEMKQKFIIMANEVIENSIPKQVVIDKINEINKAYEDSKDENGESPYYYPDYTVRVLQELLETK